MVRIRLKRIGKKQKPFYRIIVIDSRKKIYGQYIEQVGQYSPITKNIEFDKDLVMKWLKYGAQPSLTVKSLLSKKGIIKDFVDTKKKKIAKKNIKKISSKNEKKIGKTKLSKITKKNNRRIMRKKTKAFLNNKAKAVKENENKEKNDNQNDIKKEVNKK